MPTNKTALEMLIEVITNAMLDLNTANYTPELNTLKLVQEQALKLLPTERTQIEEAFDKGTSNGINIATRTGTTYKKASDYFTQKYKDGE